MMLGGVGEPATSDLRLLACAVTIVTMKVTS